MAVDLRKHYPKDWMVLQNRVTECYRGMSLDEKRLFIMASHLLEQRKYQAMIPFLSRLVTTHRNVV